MMKYDPEASKRNVCEYDNDPPAILAAEPNPDAAKIQAELDEKLRQIKSKALFRMKKKSEDSE